MSNQIILLLSFLLFLASLSSTRTSAYVNSRRVVRIAADMGKLIGSTFIATSLLQLPLTNINTLPVSAGLPLVDGVQVQPDNIDRRRVMEEPVGAPEQPKAKVVKLPSGVEYFDVKVGAGPAAEEGKTVQFQWVLRRSNGYFVDASSNYNNEPFIYKVGNTKKVIKGVDEAIRGMQVGGVRRMNIPPGVAFTEGVGDDKPGPMPAGFGPRRQILTRIDKEVWYFEIQLVKVKQ